MCGSHAWNDQRNNSYAYAWTDSRIHPIEGATAAHNSTSSNCSTAQPRYSTSFMCSHASSSPSGEGAMATHNSILALWHLACLHADGPYDSFSSQVREQWQHTIAQPATARQPNPGTWWAGALQCTVRKWEWHNHVPMLTIHTPHGTKGPARLARGIEPPLPGANPGRCFRTQLHKSVVRVLVRVYSVRVNGPEECQNPAAAKQPSPGSGLDL